jgi:hypothetical protein
MRQFYWRCHENQDRLIYPNPKLITEPGGYFRVPPLHLFV